MSETKSGASFREASAPHPAGSIAAAPDAALPPPDSARDWKKARRVARRRLERFLSLAPKVQAGGNPDAIHDLRVASRRLQQVLDMVYPPPPPREIRRLRRRIRRCRRAFGTVRNFDVFLNRVDRILVRKRVSHREAWAALQEYLRVHRAELFPKAIRKFNKQNLTGLYLHLRAHLRAAGTAEAAATVPSEGGPLTETSGPNLRAHLTESLEQLWTAFQARVEESRSDPSIAAIHAVRLATKRLRYLLEVIYEFRVPGCAEQIVRLRRLQQHLGDWHDIEVQNQIAARMVARPAFLHEHLGLCQNIIGLLQREQVRKKGYKEKYFLMVRESTEWQQLSRWINHLLVGWSASLPDE